MEITHGFRSVLSAPIVYETFQSLMRDKNLYNELVNIINDIKNPKILDIGCGSAEILRDLKVDKYVGFDISERYIEQAKTTHNSNQNCTFISKEFSKGHVQNLDKFNVVLFKGLMHHLSDSEVLSLIEEVKEVSAQGALILTIDPVFVSKQNPISKLLVSLDRGQNVRTFEQYSALLSQNLKLKTSEHRHQFFIPYDRCFFVCEVN